MAQFAPNRAIIQFSTFIKVWLTFTTRTVLSAKAPWPSWPMYHHEPSAVICKPVDQSSILWASRQRPRSCRLRLFATSARIIASIFHRNCRTRKRSQNRRFTSLFSVCCRKESLFIKKMNFFLPMSDKVGQSLFEMLYLCIVFRITQFIV